MAAGTNGNINIPRTCYEVKTMSDRDQLLIELLAETDALWWPDRSNDQDVSTRSTLAVLRMQYPSAGVPFSGHDKERSLPGLVDEGLVETFGKGKALSAGLTDHGDAYARALAYLPSIVDAYEAMQEIIRLAVTAKDAYARSLGPLCSELWLTTFAQYERTEACKVAYVMVSERLAPAFCRQWVESRSDQDGRAYYRVMPEGLRVAAGPPPSLPEGLPESREWAAAAYYPALNMARARFRVMESPRPTEVGPPSLPVSLCLRRKKVSP